MGRRIDNQPALGIPAGLSRWWVERHVSRGSTLAEAIAIEQARRARGQARRRQWLANGAKREEGN